MKTTCNWLAGRLWTASICRTYVKGNVDCHHADIHIQQSIVLGEAVGNKAVLDQVNEADVEPQVDQQENTLFYWVPDLVD